MIQHYRSAKRFFEIFTQPTLQCHDTSSKSLLHDMINATPLHETHGTKRCSLINPLEMYKCSNSTKRGAVHCTATIALQQMHFVLHNVLDITLQMHTQTR